MKRDDEFDACLARELDAPPLPAGDFVLGVTSRLERHRRRRFWALSGAIVVAGMIFSIAAHLSAASVPSFPAITPGTIVAALLLIAGCSLVWIETESGLL